MTLLGKIINDPSKIEIKEASDLALRAQVLKVNAQSKAYKELSKITFTELNRFNLDQLDSFLADLTCGPGNFIRYGWKKETFISKILTHLV